MRVCRRSLLFVAAVALAAVWGTNACAQQHPVHLVVRQTATQSLTLIKPSDPNFEGMLDTYFPGLSQEDAYEHSIKPFLVIVRNDNDYTAVAYAITWTVHYIDGSSRPLRAMFVNRPLMYRPANTYLGPGGIRLIAPMFNVTPDGYQWYHSFGLMYPSSSFPPSDELAAVDVNVDGVVYGDGTFIGLDKTHILQRRVAARFAERDEALAVMNFIEASAPSPLLGQQLLRNLGQEIRQDDRATQRTLFARYVRARGLSAQDVRRILGGRGIAGLQTALGSFVDRSGGDLRPSMFDGEYRSLSQNDPRVFGDFPWNPGEAGSPPDGGGE